MSKGIEALERNYQLYAKITCEPNKIVKDEFLKDNFDYQCNKRTAEMELEAWRIVNTKNVDILTIRSCKTVEQYNAFVMTSNSKERKILLQEEFKSIKEILEWT